MKTHIYHGSDHIVKIPRFHGGKPHNDYGHGFYCTKSPEMAKEWAVSEEHDGYANCYEIDLEGLQILNLNRDYTILTWLTVLIQNRTFNYDSPLAAEVSRYLRDNFSIDTSKYDVIIGYRADDSYFTFAQDFVSNAIPLSKLSEAMRLGKPGEQIVFKSETSFTRIHFTGAEPASASIYYEKKTMRDRNARREYWKAKKTDDTIHGLYMLDIMREGITNGDSRLR